MQNLIQYTCDIYNFISDVYSPNPMSLGMKADHWTFLTGKLLPSGYVGKGAMKKALMNIFCHLDQGGLGQCFLTIPNS